MWIAWHDGDDVPFGTFETREEAELNGKEDFDYIEEDETARQWAWNKHTSRWDEL